MKEQSTSVLVVGGGLVGLSSALFLGAQKVPMILVERHPGSSPHPRAIGYTQRTMELFRTVGLADKVPQVPPGFRLLRARVESLAGEWFEQTRWTPGQQEAPPPEHSPCTGAAIAQDRLEPILRDRARELGADVRLETELLRFEQDATGVLATVRTKGGEEYPIRASYLIAADGFRSPIRETLKIGCQGRGHLRTARSVLFRAPLEQYLEKGVSQFEIEQPSLKAFLTTYQDGRWVLMFPDDAERDEAALRDMIVKAIGRDDLPIEIITTGRWELSARIANTFSSGRVFLAGDAAHTLPPTRGGYGANTGIEDAHNLAWKLSAVVSGASKPALLDSYDAERRPVAWLRHDQTFARPDYSAHGGPDAANTPILEEEAIELGQLYRSSAVLGAGPELPAAKRPDVWAGQPGTRAPHAWVTVNGERRSTLDLFQRGWLLLAHDERWRAIAAAVGDRLRLPLTCLCVGTDVVAVDGADLQAAFGVGSDGASLIRPDGYVGFRSTGFPPDATAVLFDALSRLTARTRG